MNPQTRIINNHARMPLNRPPLGKGQGASNTPNVKTVAVTNTASRHPANNPFVQKP